MSTNKRKPPSPQPPRVGSALARLRQLHSLSLDELSRQSGVSKSMLSQIERGQANPTVAVVWRLATGSACRWPSCWASGGPPSPC